MVPATRDDETFDDADHMAYAHRKRAIATREVSARGLLESLAHPALFEDAAYDDVVIDGGFIEHFAKPASPEHGRIAREVEPVLRTWLTLPHRGKQQRARYALIRFLGPEADVVMSGLATPGADGGAALLGTLHALQFPSLPESLLTPLRRLLKPRELTKIAKALGDTFQVCRLVVDLLQRIDSPKVIEALIEALDVEDTRLIVVESFQKRRNAKNALNDGLVASVRQRFAGCTEAIARSKAGLPDRVAMALGGALAQLVKRDAEMATQAARVLHLLPGLANQDAELVTPFAELIARSIDALPRELLEPLARQMTLPPPERLPAAAAAWVRLDVEQARALAAKFNSGNRASEDLRWLAAAQAHLAWSKRSDAIEALIPEKSLAVALARAPRKAPPGLAARVLAPSVRSVRSAAELVEIVRAASALGEFSVTRPLLAKLREAPFEIDADLESLLPPLFSADFDDWVEQEIDGENTYPERRKALGRALKRARAARTAKKATPE